MNRTTNQRDAFSNMSPNCQAVTAVLFLAWLAFSLAIIVGVNGYLFDR